MEKSTFHWTGINKLGNRISGEIQALDTLEAQRALKKQEIEIIKLAPKKSSEFFSKRKPKIKAKDIVLFTRYLSTMMSAGLPIVQALDVMSKDQENSTMQAMIAQIKTNVVGGKTLSEAFKEYPQYFPKLYQSLVHAGEKSGTLEKILKRLGDYLDKIESIKRKVKKALIYPIAIISIAMIVSGILLFFVVPQFEKVFHSFGAQLPLFTRMVMEFSHLLRVYGWIILLAILGMAWGGARIIKRSEKVRYFLDGLILKIYIMGPILRKSIIARFTRTLAITLEAGLPIMDAMKSMADLMGNLIYRKAVLEICDSVVSGNQLSSSLEKTKLFPNMVIQMIAVGEASGALSDMLNKVADYYEEEVNSTVDNLGNLLEPLIMVVLGIIIGGFVVAMYLPIFKLGSLF